jgi:kelch-like protein 17 (actinfilin)/kelch-like protein 20
VERLEERTLPDAGFWNPVASLPTGQTDIELVAGSDGRVYALGGRDFSIGFTAVTNKVARYDPATNAWAAVAPMADIRWEFAATLGPDGRIYALGGRQSMTPAFGGGMNRVEAYDPAANAWVAVAPMRTDHHNFAAATGPDGRVYAIGRYSYNPFGPFPPQPSQPVEAYDPATNTWTSVANLPAPSNRPASWAATWSDRRIYVWAGQMFAFDPATDTWAEVAFPALPRSYGGLVTGADGRLYHVGGRDASHLPSSTAVDVYDPATNTWQAVAPMQVARSNLGVATAGDGRIYAVGGDTDLRTVEAFTPPGSAAARFVTQAYQDLLGRDPEPAGLAYWGGLVITGTKRSDVVLGIEGSAEYRDRLVREMYGSLLRREADPAGLSYFMGQLAGGATAVQVRTDILASAEYFARRGAGTTTGFLANLYQDVLGRGVDPVANTVYGPTLAGGGSRAEVAAQVLASMEAESRWVGAAYRRYLGREAEDYGLVYHLTAMQHGAREEDVLAAVLGSAEYLNR